MPAAPGTLVLDSSLGLSATTHSVVSNIPAIEAAFSIAIRVTFVNMYTVVLAYELKNTNFKINAVCPGQIKTVAF